MKLGIQSDFACKVSPTFLFRSPRSVESGSTSTPLFLRPGSSYQGKTASTRIANTISNVAVLGKKNYCATLHTTILLSRHIQLSNNLYHCGMTTVMTQQIRSLSLIIIFAVLTFLIEKILEIEITKKSF